MLQLRHLAWLLFCVFSLAFFAGCSSKEAANEVSLTGTSFEEEVPTVGNLTFYFSKDIAPDSVQYYWIDEELISFDPEIEGSFQWISSSELIFSPLGELPAGTDYKAKINTKEILQFSNGLNWSGDKEVSFHTPYLNLLYGLAYWIMEEGEAVVQLDLNFNYPVEPSEVVSRLNISVDGEDQKVRLASNEVASTVSLFVEDFAALDDDIKAEIEIDKGLLPSGGNVKSDESFDLDIVIPSPYVLDVQNVETSHDGVEGTITVMTSQGIREGEVKDYVRISPYVNFDINKIDEGFEIVSEDFDSKNKYNLTLKTGLAGEVGGKLKSDYYEEVTFGELRPSIKIANSKGLYVSRNGYRNVGVSIINVEQLRVRVYKIYENNLIAANYQGFYPDNYYYDDYYYDDYYYYGDDYQGDMIWEGEFTTKELNRLGGTRLLQLDFPDKVAEYNGVYFVEIASTEDYWVRDRRYFAVSDIGLITKVSEDKVFIFANSIENATPMQQAKVEIIGVNNQVVGSAVTDAQGTAVIDLVDKGLRGFKPYMVTASAGDDFNYMMFNNRASVEMGDFDVGGKRLNPSGMEAFIYPERDIYRPGEEINIAVIVRDHFWNQPGQIPVKGKLVMPNGKEYKSIRKTLNNQGSFETSFQLSPSVVTGTYTFELYTSNDLFLASRSFQIEEFMPDRIKVKTTLDKSEYYPEDDIEIDIHADNFFGPPAANRNYEVELSFARKYFRAKDYPGYNFYIQNADRYFSTEYFEGSTDDNGDASEVYTVPESFENSGMLKADVYTTVFDETGRPVNTKKTVDIVTQDEFYGIKYFPYYASTKQKLQIPLIAVDKNGKALSDVKGRFQIIKYEYKTILERSGSYYRYRSQKEEKILKDESITLSGDKTVYSFVPEVSGEYEVRLFKPGTNRYVSRRFYSYGWGYTYNSSFEVNNAGTIDIELDKESYYKGDMAKILMKTPFSGRMLVTVENNTVLDHFYVDTDNKSASIELKLSKDYVPNVYISATLIKPHGESDIPLTVAHGFQPISVEDPATNMPVEIIAEKESRSNVTQKIKVKAFPDSKVTVAVVDEGILQLTGFSTPSPHGFFYQKRALGVKSYDIYPMLFPELASNIGAGGGFDLEKRVNPMQNKRVKLVSYWSGILQTNKKGEAEFEVDIPQFSGDLRIMAVAHHDQAFGSASDNMIIADPIVLSTALPRFLSPMDTAEVPVTLSNTTGKSAKGKVTIKTEGPLTVVGTKKESVNIGANSEDRVVFQIVSHADLGSGKVTVSADALGETFKEEIDITVRPASPLIKQSGSGIVEAGKSARVDLNASNLMPSSVDYKLVISKSPLVQFTDDLDYLVRYPYGCTEQTISAAFPQLYYRDIVTSIYGKSDKQVLDPTYHVQEAIRKITVRQLYNGGLTLWPNSGYESWWTTVYAAHFLQEAKMAGYEVDQSVLDGLYGYMTARLKNKETISYYYNRNQNRKIAPKEVSYSLYVLAMAGKPQASTMNYYKANDELLSLDGKYLLAAAYFVSGDRKKYQELLPAQFSGEVSAQQFGGSFYSPVRDEAIALNALIEADPDNEQIGIMSKHLTEYMKTRRYLNTQERVFCFLALGKIARMSADTDATAEIRSGGKGVATYKDGTLTLESDALESGDISIEAKGNGRLYYFWEAEGISKDGSYEEIDNYMKVRRTFYDRYGKVITKNTFEQNDLVVVKLSITGANNTAVDNVVISDIIPACFEIENPRVDDIPGTSWISDQSYPTHRDIRDDRINLFVNVNQYTRHYYYVVRAVSRGTYHMGPVGADAMYNGEYHSYHGAGLVKVIEKK